MLTKIMFCIVNLCVCLSLSLIRCLDKVSTSVLPYFNTVATKLIEERGAVEVVSAALAYISGMTTEMKSRSLLSSQPVSHSLHNANNYFLSENITEFYH